MREYSTAVFIGRFQPFHNSHSDVVRQGLEIAEKVVILVGSSTAARSEKNPFTLDERKEMIYQSVPESRYALRERVFVHGIRDYYYSMETWLASVQAITDPYIAPGDSVALLGSFKDASSYYLRSFPQWDHVPTLPGKFHGSDIRKAMYESVAASKFNGKVVADWEGKLVNPPGSELVLPYVPSAVAGFLTNWMKTPEFVVAAQSYHDTKAYKASWSTAPFPPTFVTTDAVVICSGHVLVVKRKFNPGKGLYALPGGFLKQDEKIRAGILRELKEETGIRVDKQILDSRIEEIRVFDHPDRSQRGRTITHAGLIRLQDGELPEVRGNDDAASAVWMPLWDVFQKEDQFFEDHAHIINAMVGVQRER